MGVKSYIAVNLCHPVFEPFNLLQTPADSVSMKSAISAATIHNDGTKDTITKLAWVVALTLLRRSSENFSTHYSFNLSV